MEPANGGPICLYEFLYKYYSRLQFTRVYDRPIAIAGLEKRLIRAFDTEGGFGAFECYFGRSLMWQRASDAEYMLRIDFPPETQYRVPTWSWMAYTGPITFMDLPFDSVEWEAGDSLSPWKSSSASGSHSLIAIARGLNLAFADGNIVFDSSEEANGRIISCVVVGRQKLEIRDQQATRMHYVLIVAPKRHAGKDNIFERVGVGSLSGNGILFNGPGLEVRIC